MMMKRILVTGATGCVGRAAVQALRGRGHHVVEGSRSAADSLHRLHVDFSRTRSPQEWAGRLRALDIDTVVNCAGILMPSAGQSFERVHAEGPIELFRGAAQAGVRRVVQVSALGVDDSAASLATPYLASKLRADDALASMPVEWAVLRPSLVYGPGSHSAALFATLASLPVIGLPGRGLQAMQPLHVFEVAEAIVRLVEQTDAPQAVFELGGAARLCYREMLSAYREALGLGPALWLPVPMPLMRVTARLAEALPQKVFCRDTLGLLERGNAPSVNAAPALLGRMPCSLSKGLRVTPPAPLLDLSVRIAPAPARAMRAALAAVWLWMALVGVLLPGASGMHGLLHRSGVEGHLVAAAWVGCCVAHVGLAMLAWAGTSPWVWATQMAAVCLHMLIAALEMPGPAMDHAGLLMAHLPALALICALWLAAPSAPVAAPGRKTASPA